MISPISGKTGAQPERMAGLRTFCTIEHNPCGGHVKPLSRIPPLFPASAQRVDAFLGRMVQVPDLPCAAIPRFPCPKIVPACWTAPWPRPFSATACPGPRPSSCFRPPVWWIPFSSVAMSEPRLWQPSISSALSSAFFSAWASCFPWAARSAVPTTWGAAICGPLRRSLAAPCCSSCWPVWYWPCSRCCSGRCC